MPELPEVTTIIGVLKPILIGKKLEKVTVYRDKNIFSGAREFEEKLSGTTILGISRKGKYLIFDCDHDLAFECHLRMEGKFYLREKDEPKDKHDIVDFYLPDCNTVIEFDGAQHFVPSDYFGVDAFNKTVEHDNIKNNYCSDNEIRLIRIPYWEINNINNILDKELAS